MDQGEEEGDAGRSFLLSVPLCFYLGATCILSEEGNPAGLSSCSGGLRPLVELCVEPAGLCGRCTGVAVPLRASG